MKKFFVSLLLSFTLTTGFAQSFSSLQWSDAFEPATGQYLHGLFGNRHRSFMLFTNSEHTFSAMSFFTTDAAGRVTKTVHTLTDPAYALTGAYTLNNNVVVLLEFQREEDGLFVQELKSLVFTPSGPTQEKILLSHSVRNKTHFNKIKFTVSPDRKKTLVFAESPFKTGSNEEIKIFVFDAEGQCLNGSFTMEIESKQNVHNYPQLSNSGVVYFLKRDKDKTQQFRYYLYAFVPGEDQLSRKLIALPGTAISDIRGTVTPSGEFLVGGFTSSENIHEYEGYFLFKFDQACNQKFKTQSIFDETTFLKFLSKKEYSKNPALTNYFIENITVGPSGRIYMTAEAYDEKNTGKNGWYNYRDVMLVAFSESGSYTTTFRVTKEQETTQDLTHWASFKTFYNRDTLVMLHNNLVKNEGSAGPEPLLQQTRVHENTFTGTASPAYTMDPPNDTPFFNPDLFAAGDQQYFFAVFSSLDRKFYRILRADL